MIIVGNSEGIKLSNSRETKNTLGSLPETPISTEEQGDFDLRDLLRVIHMRKNWIIGAVVVCVLIACVVNYTMRPVYQSTATIELNKSGASVDLGLSGLMGGQLSEGNDLKTDLQTEITVMREDSLALEVIESQHLESQAPFAQKTSGFFLKPDKEAGLPLKDAPARRTRLLAIFGKLLEVKSLPGTRLIEVSFSSNNPEQAAAVANAVVNSYKKLYLQSHYMAKAETSDWLGKQLLDLKDNVEDSEKKLASLEKQSGILNLQGMNSNANSANFQSPIVDKLGVLNVQLTNAEVNRVAREALYRIVRGGSEEAIAELSQNSATMNSPSQLVSSGVVANLMQLRQQRNQIAIEISEAAAVYGSNNRKLKDLQNTERAIESQIQAETKEIIRSAYNDYVLAKQTENNLRKEYNEQQAAAAALNDKAVDLAILGQEAVSRKKLYEDLYSKLQEANVAAGIKATNFTMVDPARAESAPIRPRRQYNILIGAFVGLIVGVLLAFVVDRIDASILSAIEMERVTQLPVLGVVPEFSEGGAKSFYAAGKIGIAQKISSKPSKSKADDDGNLQDRVWILRHPESGAAEAIRSVRTSLLLSRAGGDTKVFLVTSCVPGEGKSTMSANIAVSFVMQGKKVVIVEADMRRPTLKHVLNVDNSRGLSNVLSSAHTLDECLQKNICIEGLDVLPSGPKPPLPSELLGAPVFSELIQKLRERYDVVIIDSPPVLLLTDAVLISNSVDVVVWVAVPRVSKRAQMFRAAQVMRRHNMPVVGIVMNRANKLDSMYGYGYGYGYGNGYNQYGYYSEEE